ncbi:MAG: DUF2207 domain-containing protein [Nitrospirae bacterium]|nr:DUF2207 domain-containing protein [Nitrospirota bacterium]
MHKMIAVPGIWNSLWPGPGGMRIMKVMSVRKRTSARILIRGLCVLILLVCLQIPFAAAEERVLDFHSEITVHQDATMTVKETITVRAEGVQIKRGIFRDFPTKYEDSRGNPYVVGFRVESVARDGSPEPYHTTSMQNGERVYIGEKNAFLRHGEYTYVLTYTTDHQLGFFQDFDELYWNVTGNGWDFPIDKASAEIHLPDDAGGKIISTAGYTGPQGSKGTDFEEERPASGSISFSTTRALGVREGLTVAVSWPKGYVVKPPDRPVAEAEEMVSGAGAAYAGIGILILISFYMLVWSRVGRDPEAGSVMVRYTPPSDMTPAVMRFIMQMGYDDKCFAAALINMAVKGHVAVHEDGGEYRLKKQDGGSAPLAPEEKKMLDKLLGSAPEIGLVQRNHASIRGAVTALKEYLKQKYEKVYFITNRRYFITGLVITALLLLASGFGLAHQKQMVPAFIFICVWLTGWSVGVIVLVLQVMERWKATFHGGSHTALNGAGAVFLTLFSLPFIAGEIVGMTMLAKFSSVMVVVFLIISMAVNYLFFHLLKAPTRAGRTVLDAVEGFRMFLSATEKDRMNMMNPSDRTPETFERFLPYALALNVEQQWAEQFASVLSKAAAEGYQPAW